MNIEINNGVFGGFPELETDRLILRSFTKDDAKDFFLVRSDPIVMEYMDSQIHRYVSDSLSMIDNILGSFNDMSGINWAIEEKASKTFAGYCCFHRLMRANARAEIGYALRKEYWGKGIAKDAICALIKFGFGAMGLHGIEANVNPKNITSKKLLEKLGFKKEAYFREYHLHNKNFIDSEIYCLIESDVNV